MDNYKSFYISALANASDGTVTASVRLPIPLDGKYEVSLVYCEFEPDWNALTDLKMVFSSEQGKQIIEFDDLMTEDLPAFIDALAEKLKAEYGDDMRQAKTVAKIEKVKNKYLLKIQKKTAVKMSKNLSALLQLPRVISNEEGNSSIVREFTPHVPHDVHDKYCLSCDQLKPNYIATDGSIRKILSFIPAAPFQKFSSTTLPVYHQLIDDSLLHSLTIRLLSDEGEPIYSYSHLFVHLHIKHVETAETKLA